MLQCCPKLQTLCIAIDTDTFTEVPLDRPGGGVQNMNIWTLAFADLVIQPLATTVVAAFLSDVVFKLNEVTAWKSDQMCAQQDADKRGPDGVRHLLGRRFSANQGNDQNPTAGKEVAAERINQVDVDFPSPMFMNFQENGQLPGLIQGTV
ncbi:hypothetical protein BDR05DRAFT_1045753 [Suillus weaverae]|nr:hypothetical protein BDR05DRAFT_1045753 [Suillus weaverae]